MADFWIDDSEYLYHKAREYGWSLAAYRCPCETCSRTSQLCTAALTDLGDDVDREEERNR